MFEFIPQLIIIVCIVAVIIIVARKVNKTSDIDENKIDKKKQNEFIRLVKKGSSYMWELIKRMYYRLFRRMKTKVEEVKEKTKITKEKEDEEELEQLAEDKPVAVEVASQATADEIIDMIEKASSLYGKGQYDQAEKIYIKIISKDPKNIRAYKGLGRIYKRQRNFKDAQESFRQVLEIDPSEKEAKKELRELTGNK